MAVLAMAGGAIAQSPISIYGSIDTSLVHLSIPGSSVTGLSSGGRAGSKLGFRGAEDLGGGYQLNLLLEGSYASDGNGSSFQFSGHSRIGLQGGFGELHLGRDANIVSRLRDEFTPTGGAGTMGLNSNNQLDSTSVGSITGSSPWSSPNSIIYNSPKIGGMYAKVGHSFGEQAGNFSLGSNTAMRLGYASGPLHLTLGYNLARGGTDNQGIHYRTCNLGASYRVAGFTPMLLIGSERGSGKRIDLYNLGMKYRQGHHEWRGTYTYFQDKMQDRANTQRLALGYSYLLSMRTEIYSAISRVDNQDKAARKLAALLSHSVEAGQSISSYEVGIYHSF